MVQDISQGYTLVDTTIGTRLMLGFNTSISALQRRLRSPWLVSSPPVSYVSSASPSKQIQPNLILVFNDMLLNQDGQGQVRVAGNACYVGFSIPVANPETGEHGMMHFRNFTGYPDAVPGAYRDALPAQVRHERHIIGEGTSLMVIDTFEIHPDIGGSIELQLAYERGPIIRRVSDSPNFPVWSTLDSRIMRVYQENTLLDLVRNNATGINRVQHETFRLTVPEMADLFDGNEQLITIIANPQYERKVFSSGIEYADLLP